MNNRATALAERIEQGAANLAAFAETLSDAEWQSRVADGRTVAAVVHHVATVYPIEVELAQATANGKSVADITWDVVNTMNDKHGVEFANVSKADALQLLAANSKAAASSVRSLSDEQLDNSGPFGLAYGAPVTTQFVIEDHALRHSWHHLFRIRAALGYK
jgi:hypothetical protein